MDTRVYSLNGEVFYVVSTPNGYCLVTHGGPVGSAEMDIVGYFGPGSMERAQIHMDGRTSRIGVRRNTISSVRSLGVGSLTLLP